MSRFFFLGRVRDNGGGFDVLQLCPDVWCSYMRLCLFVCGIGTTHAGAGAVKTGCRSCPKKVLGRNFLHVEEGRRDLPAFRRRLWRSRKVPAVPSEL